MEYVESGAVKMNWPDSIPKNIRNEVAKYLPEVTIGMNVWDRANVFKDSSEFVKKAGKMTRFLLPDDAAFSGIDSFLISNKEFVPISSKSGTGAKASLFTNFFKQAVEKNIAFKSTILKDYMKVLQSNKDGVAGVKSAKNSVFSYVIRNILKINNTQLSDVSVFLKEVTGYRGKAKGKDAIPFFSKPSQLVLTALLKQKGKFVASGDLFDNLPFTVAGIFTREIAGRMNADKVALTEILQALGMKEFFQANLNAQKFTTSGITEYKIAEVSQKSGRISIAITGAKSAATDLSMKQGSLNYEVRIK